MPASLLGARLGAPPPSSALRPAQQQRQALQPHLLHARSAAAAAAAPAPIAAAPARLRRSPLAPPPRAGGKGDRGTTGNGAVDDALKVGGGLVDAAADLVPASVPRPVAKAGVAVAGVAVAFWLLQKVVSTVLTLALLAGGLYLYLSRGGGGDEGEGGAASSSSSSRRQGGAGGGKDDGGGDDDDDDPLAEARRIMSKYTK